MTPFQYHLSIIESIVHLSEDTYFGYVSFNSYEDYYTVSCDFIIDGVTKIKEFKNKVAALKHYHGLLKIA